MESGTTSSHRPSRAIIAACLMLPAGLIACETSGFVFPSGVEISYVAPSIDASASVPRYSLVCAPDQASLDAVVDSPDPSAAPNAFVEGGELARVTHDISGVPTEVWGVSFYDVPVGVCRVQLRQVTDPDCSLSEDFTVRPETIEALQLFPACAGRLCPPRGDALLGFRVPDGYSTLILDAALRYTLECDGTGEGFFDDPCDPSSFEGSVGMANGPHQPHIGPIQDGSWELRLSEISAGSCMINAQATVGNQTPVCEATETFEVPIDGTASLQDIVLTCVE